MDATAVVGRVSQAYENKMFDAIGIDSIGVGAGVFDMIKNIQIPCVAVNVGESSSKKEKYARMRDELWWSVRLWFEEANCSISPSIPEIDRQALVKDIQDIRYSFTNNGLIKIESKDEMKERLGFSPDLGDALCCTFATRIQYKIPSVDRQFMGKSAIPYLEPVKSEKDDNPLYYGMEVN